MNAHDSIRAYHAGKRELGEDVLDELLHIPARLGRHAAADHAAVQRAHPGESVVDVPTPYVICRRLFAAITLTERDRFVDLGCAAGRVVLYGGVVSPAQFVGIELIAERAAIAREAAQRLGLESVVINTGDALDHDYGTGTVFYLFRPFSVETEEKVVARLHREARRRAITVVAYRLQPALFDLDVFEREERGDLAILRANPASRK